MNGVSKIRASINSALNQAGNFGIRLHVQDGGSSDGTVELVESIARGISNGEIGCDADRVHFSFSSESDTGLYHALRRGFAELDVPGSSPLTWINAGDYFLPGAFQCASQIFAAESSVRWIVPPIHVVAEGQLVRALRMQYPRTVVAAGMCDGLNWPTIQQEGSFWRREVWDRDCQAIEGFQLAGDWALWREFANAETPFHVTRPLAAFCVSEGQLSSSSKRYQREIRRHRSDREVAVAFESCVECCMGLRVPVIDENCGIRYESLAIERFLESGAREPPYSGDGREAQLSDRRRRDCECGTATV